MGGSDRSGPRRGPQPSNRCGDFDERLPLSSPKAAVLRNVAVGDVLDVIAYQHRNLAPTVVALHGGQIAGSILSTRSPFLIRCLQNGHEFEAEVLELAGGLCTVQVRSKS
jgi:hypothetical protein